MLAPVASYKDSAYRFIEALNFSHSKTIVDFLDLGDQILFFFNCRKLSNLLK